MLGPAASSRLARNTRSRTWKACGASPGLSLTPPRGAISRSMAGGRLVGVAEAGTVMSRAVVVYRMNPAEDKIIFGDELAGGM